MFSFEKIKVQLIIGVAVLAVISVLGFGLKHYYDANLKAQEQISGLIATNKELDKQLALLKEAGVISDKAITEQHKTIEDLRAINADQKTQVNNAVQKVVIRYASLPQTDVNNDLRDRDISTVRITGLWKTFCFTRPEITECSQLPQENPDNEK